MDSAKDLDAFAKRAGKVIAASIVHVILGAHCMGNAKMGAAFAKQASMESTALFRHVPLWTIDKENFATVVEHVK